MYYADFAGGAKSMDALSFGELLSQAEPEEQAEGENENIRRIERKPRRTRSADAECNVRSADAECNVQ